MREIKKIQKCEVSKCSFAGCEITSGDSVYFLTIGTKKYPFCHDCATRLGELFDIPITGDEDDNEFANCDS